MKNHSNSLTLFCIGDTILAEDVFDESFISLAEIHIQSQPNH